MSMSESRHHSPQISRNSKLSNYHGVSQADCTKRYGIRHASRIWGYQKHRIPGDRRGFFLGPDQTLTEFQTNVTRRHVGGFNLLKTKLLNGRGRISSLPIRNTLARR